MGKSITGSRGEVMNTSRPAYIIQASTTLPHRHHHQPQQFIIITSVYHPSLYPLPTTPAFSSLPLSLGSKPKKAMNMSLKRITSRLQHHKRTGSPNFWCKITFLLRPPFACQPFNRRPVRPAEEKQNFFNDTFSTRGLAGQN